VEGQNDKLEGLEAYPTGCIDKLEAYPTDALTSWKLIPPMH
jgi:hypothetical protein